MMAQASRDWSVFKQIFADHWQGFKQFRPRYDTPYYDSLVEKMLDCGNSDYMGYIERVLGDDAIPARDEAIQAAPSTRRARRAKSAREEEAALEQDDHHRRHL